MIRQLRAGCRVALAVGAGAWFACSSPPPKPPAPAPLLVASVSISGKVPLAEITLQSALEAAWDGDFAQCLQRARSVIGLAPNDLESMELAVRCAHANKSLDEYVGWIKSAYSVRLASPVARYGLGIAHLVRGELAAGRKLLENLVAEAPAAAYQAAIAAQIDDDLPGAEKLAARYVAVRPNDPAGRMLLAELVCTQQVERCAKAIDEGRTLPVEPDAPDVTLARRLGSFAGTPVVVTSSVLLGLSKDAEGGGSAAFADSFGLASLLRQGDDPAAFSVRSPRSGRPEPGTGIDLEQLARPLSRLPFVTRVLHLASMGDHVAAQLAYSRLLALFPTEQSTYRLVRRAPMLVATARKELEHSRATRFRVIAALDVANKDDICELAGLLLPTDRGLLANVVRGRCELASDAVRARKSAKDKLAKVSYSMAEVELLVDALGKDAASLLTLAKQLSKSAPKATQVGYVLIAAADATPGAKKAATIYTDALLQSHAEPALSRRALKRFVDLRDFTRAKLTLAQSLVESPLDSYLCGVQGEILLRENKFEDALIWLTKSCMSARARKELDVLSNTLTNMPRALAKATNPTMREAALRCINAKLEP